MFAESLYTIQCIMFLGVSSLEIPDIIIESLHSCSVNIGWILNSVLLTLRRLALVSTCKQTISLKVSTLIQTLNTIRTLNLAFQNIKSGIRDDLY